MSEQDSTAQVEFRPIPGFPGYRVGSDGTVWSCRHQSGLKLRWKIKATWPQKKNKLYRMVSIACNGKQFAVPVHRIVLEAFIGPCPDGMEACHNDGDPTNNNLSNLRWDTRKANHADQYEHGTRVLGERVGTAKLKAEIVLKIREEYSQTETTFAQLARKYGVHPSMISLIVRRKSWKHI